jgi:ribose/xylose/arabinose/galactoside ABC-type transport system permease subunit
LHLPCNIDNVGADNGGVFGDERQVHHSGRRHYRAVKGIAVYATSGGVIGGFPAAVLFLGNGTLLGFPVPMILFILCAILVAVIMTHAPFGVSVRMIGSNEKATRYSGVATEWMGVGD